MYMNQNEELERKAPEESAADTASEPVEAVAEENTGAITEPAVNTEAPEQAPSEEQSAEDAADAQPEEAADGDPAAAEEAAGSDEPAAGEAQDQDASAEPADDSLDAESVQPKKKKPFILQTPVIISIGIVLLALIGYFVYSAFFLHTPQNALWMVEQDGVTYYFEFLDDGTFVSTRGTIVECIPYVTSSDGDKDTITFQYPDAESQLNYTITGAPISRDQTMTLFNDDGTYTMTLTQVTEKISPLELPTEFTPDEALLGEWELSFNGTVISVTFNADGSMTYMTSNSIYHYSQAYNGTYTLDNGQVSFTYCASEPVTELLEYQVDGDDLTFLNMPFTRVVPATPDEA